MAVYTIVSDEDLHGFLAEYDIGELLSCKGIAEGVENSNYLLHTSSGHYILTLYEKRVDAKDLPFFLGLMEHLANAGIRCPTPIHGCDGQALRHLAGRPAAIVTFLDGICINRSQPKHCRALGESLAVMHIHGENFELRRPNALGVADWPLLFRETAPLADTVMPGLKNLIDDELGYLAEFWPQDLKQGVIHADLFPDNVFFFHDTVSGFIDFYFACNDALAYDLAICINAWCFERQGEFNATKARALTQTYQNVRHLSQNDLDALPILCRGAAMRFLLTRLYDWLNKVNGALVRPKDPKEYVERLRFHQKAGSAASYGLT